MANNFLKPLSARCQTAYFYRSISKKIQTTYAMVKQFLLALTAGTLIMSCDTGSEKLQTQIDSLTQELQTSQEFAQTLQEVGVMMDSIDANRQLLRVNMVEGTTYEDYSSRMKDINNYVKDTQRKIEDLEKSLKKSKGATNTYAATIKKLKADIEAKNAEILQLQEQVDKFRNENENLVSTVMLQSKEIDDQEAELQTKRQELALIEQHIQELMVQGKMNEADQYFARAEAVELAANRTKLAPKKKKETFREAIELYKKALSLGKSEAQAKITELEKRI
jgi:chromosome segregation ATPase